MTGRSCDEPAKIARAMTRCLKECRFADTRVAFNENKLRSSCSAARRKCVVEPPKLDFSTDERILGRSGAAHGMQSFSSEKANPRWVNVALARHAGVVVACAAAVIVSTLAACTRTGSPQRRETRVLRMVAFAEPRSLNPYLPDSDDARSIESLVYSYLIIADDRGRLLGDLAADVPSRRNGGISPDGRTYVYRLRRNVLWQDGSPFTARDVIASWRMVMDPRNDVVDRSGYDEIRSVSAPTPDTLVVRLRRRYPAFVTKFFAALDADAKPVLAEHAPLRTVGTGPFRLVAWKRGDRIVLRRFKRYFRGAARLRGIDVRFVPDAQSAAEQIVSHDADLLLSAQSALLATYQSATDVVVREVPSNFQVQVLFNCRKPGLDEVAVRRAIALALPYRDILDKVAHGVYAMARSNLPTTSPSYEALPARRHDIAAANRLLAASGWTEGSGGVRQRGSTRLSYTLAIGSGGNSVNEAAVLVQSSLAEIGVRLRIRAYPDQELASATGPVFDGDYDLAIVGTNLNWDADMYDMLACDRWYPRGINVTRFCDSPVDELEKLGRNAIKPSDRIGYYRAAERRVWSLAPYVVLLQGRRLIVASSKLRNYRPNATEIPWWNAWQWEI
jgi:peptide/nickel transport system substrate-binding protein